MNARRAAVVIALLVIVFLAHAAGRLTQIGGAQVAISILVYFVMALLLADQYGWAVHAVIALLVGILTMVATSSPFPLANIPGHSGPYLLAVYLARRQLKGSTKEIPLGAVTLMAVLTVLVSWTLFSVTTWFGLAGTPFASTVFSRFGISFGAGLVAWYLNGFVGVGIPTLIVTLILAPVLYRSIGKSLTRSGVLQRELGRP